MLKPELLRVLASSGASVAISVLADTHNGSQSRPPVESTAASAEKACEPEMPLSPLIGTRSISTPFTREKLDIITRYPLVQTFINSRRRVYLLSQ
jgi:hypothetical protein